MKYAYLRVFAVAKSQRPLFGVQDTREGYLLSVFTEKRTFDHHGKEFFYVPIDSDDFGDGAVCSARVGAEREDIVNASPAEAFEPRYERTWRASNFFLDTRGHTDGQKIAMQIRGDVGKPLAIVSSLVEKINADNPDSSWTLEVNAMVDKGDFWAAVREYKGSITSAEFNYVTPNVLGFRSQINETLRHYREAENAQTVSVKLGNKNGNLDLDNEEVREAVDYISEGGGSTKIKAGRKEVYNSENEVKAIDVEAETSEDIVQPLARRGLLERLFRK